jgi:hypothetical protein
MEHCSCLAAHTPHGSYCDPAGTINLIIIAAASTSDSATTLLFFPRLSLRLCRHVPIACICVSIWTYGNLGPSLYHYRSIDLHRCMHLGLHLCLYLHRCLHLYLCLHG